MLQLVWIELVMKLAGGLALTLLPLTTIKVLGLPKAETAFWPRLLGVVLIGLAAATFMDASVRLGHGLGLAGSVAINLVAALALTVMLVLKQGPAAWRGRAVLWLLVFLLGALVLVEIAYI